MSGTSGIEAGLCNPCGVEGGAELPQGAPKRRPWAVECNPFGVKIGVLWGKERAFSVSRQTAGLRRPMPLPTALSRPVKARALVLGQVGSTHQCGR
jgi:hypothetical protein